MNSKNISEIEEKLLACDSGDFDTGEMLALIVGATEEVGEDTADLWLSMLQDAVSTKEDTAGMLKLMVVRGRIDKITPRDIEEGLLYASKDRTWQAKVKSCAFTGKTPVQECFRRLTVLNSLKKGSFCFEKTWGFGLVKRLDAFYSKVTVDFTRKRGHQMSFGYAGESLTILDNNHIFVIFQRAPEKIADIMKDSPAEIVRMLLRSVGPKTVDEIKELLAEMKIVADADWKTFWDSARKALKKDPLVDIPTKRTAPLTILDKARGFDADWVASLSQERDVTTLLNMLEDLAAAKKTDLPDDANATISERCAFVAKAAEGSQWDVLARLLLVSRDLTQLLGSDPVAPKIEMLFTKSALTQALMGLNVRMGTGLLAMMMMKDADRCSEMLVDILENLPANLIADAAYHLERAGKEDLFLSEISERLSTRSIGPVVFSWICRTPGAFDKLKDVGRYELVNGVIDMLEGEFSGEQLKGQNTIRTCFENKQWLAHLFEGLPEAQMETLVKKIAESKGWEESSRRSVLAKLLKVHPELAEMMSSSGKEEDAAELRVTSWRSFKERSATLQKIVEIDIPANSKEIGVARSYGDLRENHEYKAAKEHQGILMRRQEELERDLKTVQGTDFTGFPSDKVGPGTMVIIRRPGGATEDYCVLGEWDRDEKLNIISSQSRLAKCLDGALPGSEVTLPGISGDEQCSVVSVSPLNDTVKAWVVSDPD